MPDTVYQPLKLNQTNRYPGYQFHARVKVDGMEPGAAFRFLILTVYHWIRSRVPEGTGVRLNFVCRSLRICLLWRMRHLCRIISRWDIRWISRLWFRMESGRCGLRSRISGRMNGLRCPGGFLPRGWACG